MVNEFEQRAAERRKSMTAHLARSKEDAQKYADEFDRAMSPVERVEAIWDLSWKLWTAGGERGTQRRLDRSVARLERRRR
jgi:hypothetical protein